jgi:tRNA 2-thiouridine synthesizing protein A
MVDSLDLRGVRCPLSWARAKVRLEQLPSGAAIELILDDAKGVQDIPRAAEAEGYAVIDVDRRQMDWRILIQK